VSASRDYIDGICPGGRTLLQASHEKRLAGAVADESANFGPLGYADERTGDAGHLSFFGEREHGKQLSLVAPRSPCSGARIEAHGENAIAQYPGKVPVIVCGSRCYAGCERPGRISQCD
jgi:hypothetical protein